MDKFLFKYENELITKEGLQNILQKIQADQCDVLYIHAGMQFGLPNLKLGRAGILDAMADVLYSLDVPTIIMPSYTFSFCNNEVFDADNTSSSMGALSEHMRTQHKWARSKDPLMSNILHGRHAEFVNDIGKNSVGVKSTFDLLSKSGLKVKFLFLGPRINDCFTYMHYLESFARVPYRYDYVFSGDVLDKGVLSTDSYTLFIRDEGVKAGRGAKIYENILIERGVASHVPFGGGSISIVELDPAREIYLDLLKLSPAFYIEEVFANPIYPNTFAARKMVAL